MNTVWVDGNRLVAYIRDRMLSGLVISRVPLLLHELRSGDRSRAAREIAGDGSVSEILTGRVVRELVNCHDSYGPDYRKSLVLVNGMARPPFRRADDRECEAWLPRFGDPSTQTPVHSDIPTLIVTGYFDDRTPAEQARRIAATLSRAYLVELPNEGHDARPGPCHAAIVAQFFEDPTRRPDTSCVATIAPIRFVTTWEPAKSPRKRPSTQLPNLNHLARRASRANGRLGGRPPKNATARTTRTKHRSTLQELLPTVRQVRLSWAGVKLREAGMTPLDAARRAERVTTSVSLVLGPLLMSIGDLLHPEERMLPAEQIAIVVDHASRWYTAHLLLYVGMLLFIPGFLGLSALTARLKPVQGYVARILIMIGTAGFASITGCRPHHGGWGPRQESSAG